MGMKVLAAGATAAVLLAPGAAVLGVATLVSPAAAGSKDLLNGLIAQDRRTVRRSLRPPGPGDRRPRRSSARSPDHLLRPVPAAPRVGGPGGIPTCPGAPGSRSAPPASLPAMRWMPSVVRALPCSHSILPLFSASFAHGEIRKLRIHEEVKKRSASRVDGHLEFENSTTPVAE